MHLVSHTRTHTLTHSHSHRPLVLGRRSSPAGDEYCIASEDCAFGPIGFERVRDVLPGEMVVISEKGQLQCRQVRG
jgi:amidophosphoribosyltransferase